jgi:hypothetical protein
VQSIFFLGYSMSGEAYIFDGEQIEAKSEDFAFGRELFSLAEELWARGEWTPHPQRVEEAGLLGVKDCSRCVKGR